MEKTMLNGLNVEVLTDTVNAIKQQPEIAEFEFRANNQWVAGLESGTTIDGFYGLCEEHRHSGPFWLVADHPTMLQGSDKAPNPLEYLLHAMAGCLATVVMAHATARGIRIDAIETNYSGKIDLRGFLGLSDEVRPGFESIAVEMRIKGDADAETLRELVAFAKSRSPAFDVVTNGVPVGFQVAAERSSERQVA